MYGQFNTLDMGVSVFLSAAVFAFAIAKARTASVRAGWMLVGWAACALAVLSKGLIGSCCRPAWRLRPRRARLDAAGRLELIRGCVLFLASPSPGSCRFVQSRVRALFFGRSTGLRFTTTDAPTLPSRWYSFRCWPWPWPPGCSSCSPPGPRPCAARPGVSAPLFLACGHWSCSPSFRLRLQAAATSFPLCRRWPCSAGVCGAHAGQRLLGRAIAMVALAGLCARAAGPYACASVQTGSTSSPTRIRSASGRGERARCLRSARRCVRPAQQTSRASACSPAHVRRHVDRDRRAPRLCAASAPRVRSPAMDPPPSVDTPFFAVDSYESQRALVPSPHRDDGARQGRVRRGSDWNRVNSFPTRRLLPASGTRPATLTPCLRCVTSSAAQRARAAEGRSWHAGRVISS